MHTESTPLEDLTALFGDQVAEPAATPAKSAPPAPTPAVAPASPGREAEQMVQELRDEIRADEGVRAQARGVSAIRAQTGAVAKSPGKPGFLESCQVRTARGLTYDFPSPAALERWLSDREDLSGCEVALPGAGWVPAAEFLAQAKAAGGPRPAPAAVEVQPSQPLVGIGERVPLLKVERREVSPRSEAPRAGALLWSLLLASWLLVLAVAAATVTRYGLLDLTPFLPLEQVGIVPPERLLPQQAEAEGLPAPPPLLAPDKAYGQALQAAREALAQKRFSRAALEFNRALAARPGAPEALEGLARAYQGLGDAERALSVLKKMQEITRR